MAAVDWQCALTQCAPPGATLPLGHAWQDMETFLVDAAEGQGAAGN